MLDDDLQWPSGAAPLAYIAFRHAAECVGARGRIAQALPISMAARGEAHGGV